MPSNTIPGPLGVIRGMTYDPVRNRYFPTPKDASSSSQQGARPIERPPPRNARPGVAGVSGSVLPLTGCDPARGNKRAKMRHTSQREGVHRPRTGRMVWRGEGPGDVDRTLERHYSDLALQSSFTCGGCHGESITFLGSFNGGAFYAGTDHGKVMMFRQDGETYGIPVCASGLTWMHCDVPRMTMLAIAGGPEAHLHHFWRDPTNLEHVFMQHSELSLPQGDIFSTSSYDDTCTLGMWQQSLTTIHYNPNLRTTRRMLTSDVLALHQTDPNLLFCGLRNGSVSLEDMRVQPNRMINRVGGTRKQKAVVGVKRLSDGAVPWGLVVSGLGDELMLFDIRFSKEPLHKFPGHINNYHLKLGLATGPDDSFLWAAGSDSRLRLYSTKSGQRVMPFSPSTPRKSPHIRGEPVLSYTPPTFKLTDDLHGRQIGPQETNPLRRVFKGRIDNICVRPDDLGVDLTVKGEVMRFSMDGRLGKGSADARNSDDNERERSDGGDAESESESGSESGSESESESEGEGDTLRGERGGTYELDELD